MIEKTVVSTSMTPDGRFHVNFNDGSSIGLSSKEDIHHFANQIEDEDMWLRLWAAYWRARDATLASSTIQTGRFTLDASAANLFRKQ